MSQGNETEFYVNLCLRTCFRRFNHICSPLGIPAQALLELAAQARGGWWQGAAVTLRMGKAPFLRAPNCCSSSDVISSTGGEFGEKSKT